MDPLDIRRTRPAPSNVPTPPRQSASQTAGPYVHIGCLPGRMGLKSVYGHDLVTNRNPAGAELVKIEGHVFDGDGAVCRDVMLEFWQADADGSYANGWWHRAGTDLDTGLYAIETIMPGPTHDAEGRTLAPHITVWITARGINVGLFTRIYFAEHISLLAADPHLALIDEARRDTLIASRDGEAYRFDIRLQGSGETVFFAV